ncbi:MAG TPA: hypothetical protein VKY27_04670, partial [Bacteriovoracaceae bacterium]|nr:hypothetical protein [Bacteriovoracaceae bacterium]
KKEVKTFHQDISKGEFSRILSYLRENVHAHGRTLDLKGLVGGEIKTKDYLNYLTEKFNV